MKLLDMQLEAFILTSDQGTAGHSQGIQAPAF